MKLKKRNIKKKKKRKKRKKAHTKTQQNELKNEKHKSVSCILLGH